MDSSLLGAVTTLLIILFLFRRKIRRAFLNADAPDRTSDDQELAEIIRREKARMRGGKSSDAD